MMKKFCYLSIIAFIVCLLSACSQHEAKNTIRVGTMAGPGTELMQVAQKVALKRYGLHVKIITFTSYNIPNQALAGGSIDVNEFQDVPFLIAQIKQRSYKIGVIGKTFVFPMGLYSKKIRSLAALPDGAKVAIPNDPSNEARGLLLLQKAGLIKLKSGSGIFATPIDVINNPKHLQFITLGAAELPRTLDDVFLAAINTNYAIPAGLSLTKDALFKEGPNSPYANIFVARCNKINKDYQCVDWQDNPHYKQLKELVKAYQSKAVLKAAKRIFGAAAIPAWS